MKVLLICTNLLVETAITYREVTAPNGYEINDTKFYFDIDSNGFVKISDKNSDENKSVFTINDKGDMTISLSNKLKWFN